MFARATDRTGLRGLALGLCAVLLVSTAGCIPPGANGRHTASMAPKTRVLPWTGGDRLAVAVSARVRYVAGPANTVTISGPARLADRIVVQDGVIRYGDDDGSDWWMFWRWSDNGPGLQIQLVTPSLTAATVSGSGRLDLGRLSQDQLDLGVSGSGVVEASGPIRTLHVGVSGSGGAQLDGLSTGEMTAGISGSGWIRASGSADTVHVIVSGSGAADLGGLAVQDADANLSGSGFARLSPKRSADVGVSGSGHVSLDTEPARLTMHQSGSGSISHPGGTAS